MEISVIIPCLNEADRILDCIERALAAGPSEVIVVDGGSEDETVRLARETECTLLSSTSGRARQQNRGAEEAQGDVLLFLHADCWLRSDALDQARESLKNSQVVGGAFYQRIEATGWRYRALEVGNAMRVRRLRMAYGDQGIFVRRHVFRNLGGFPDLPFMEDLRFMRALRRQGRFELLPGPLHISARRWQKYGVVRQTLLNWSLLTAEKLGVSPHRLAKWYPLHCQHRAASRQKNDVEHDEPKRGTDYHHGRQEEDASS